MPILLLILLISCADAQDESADTVSIEVNEETLEDTGQKTNTEVTEAISSRLDDQLDKVDEQLKATDELIELMKAAVNELDNAACPQELGQEFRIQCRQDIKTQVNETLSSTTVEPLN